MNEREPWWKKLIYIINNRSLFDTLTNGLAIKGIRVLLHMILTNLSGIRQCGIEKVGKYLVGNYKCNIIQFYTITYRRYKYRSNFFVIWWADFHRAIIVIWYACTWHHFAKHISPLSGIWVTEIHGWINGPIIRSIKVRLHWQTEWLLAMLLLRMICIRTVIVDEGTMTVLFGTLTAKF